MKKVLLITAALITTAAVLFYILEIKAIGKPIDDLNGCNIYYNGWRFGKSHGKHHSEDGYYYGKKWQCVEFIKRYYYEQLNHEMPNVWGHAKHFFDTTLVHGAMNEERNLIQFENGGDIKPAVNDIIIFRNTKYGHVGIVSEVSDGYIIVAQQNVRKNTREKFALSKQDDVWYVGINGNAPAGWLRKASSDH